MQSKKLLAFSFTQELNALCPSSYSTLECVCVCVYNLLYQFHYSLSLQPFRKRVWCVDVFLFFKVSIWMPYDMPQCAVTILKNPSSFAPPVANEGNRLTEWCCIIKRNHQVCMTFLIFPSPSFNDADLMRPLVSSEGHERFCQMFHDMNKQHLLCL